MEKEHDMSDQNLMVVRPAVEEVWNKENFSILDELVTSDLVIHSGEEIRGPEGVKQYYSRPRAALPDIHFTIEDQFAAGDRVATRWFARATHTGSFRGIPPTGKVVRMAGIEIDRLAGGKVVECRLQVDELGLLQRLGAIPAPEEGES
jgi:predicted ester cyclase